MRSRPLAYLLEGTFRSYFTGKPLPAAGGQADGAPAGKGAQGEASGGPGKITGEGGFVPVCARPGKIFLIGSSQMLANNLLDTDSQNPDSTFVMNLLDVLNDRMDISLMRSKTLTINPLEETSVRTKMFIKTFNIAGVPAMVAGIGLLAWVRRRIRKKRIEGLFARRA